MTALSPAPDAPAGEPRPLWWHGRSIHGFRCVALTPKQEAAVLRCIAEGWSSAEVAKQMGQPLALVVEVLFRHGVSPAWNDPADERKGRYKPPPRPWLPKARALAAAGKSGKEIAGALGLSPTTVWKWAQSEGRKLAPTSRATVMTSAVAAKARALARTHCAAQTARVLGVSPSALGKWASKHPDVLFQGREASPAVRSANRRNSPMVRP